jgi:hypothetical protein
VGTGARPTIYHKLAKINNHVVACFVDLGSETSLLRKSVADKLGVQQQKLDHAVEVRGFNDGILMRPKSQCQITVTIDSVSVETFIYIVEDADVRYDLLIGHSFTEHPTVLIVKTQKHLQITRLPSDAGARLGQNHISSIIPSQTGSYTVR